MRGWKFAAEQVAKRRVCVIASSRHVTNIYGELVYTLKILGLAQDVVELIDKNLVHLDTLVTSAHKPCVVINLNYCNLHMSEFLWLLDVGCIVLLVTPYVTLVPVEFLRFVPLLLWYMSYHVHVPYVAQHHSLVHKFMTQSRQALLYQGPILCDGVDNICLTLNLFDHDLAIGNIVTHMQRHFRKKREKATIIQQFIKRQLYFPGYFLGEQIVDRLKLSVK